MSKKPTVVSVAIKEKSGKVIKAHGKAHSHAQLIRQEGDKTKQVKHEFVLSNGKIATRKEAMKVAKAAGEISKSARKKLHSSDLRKSADVKLKPLK